jgi:N-acyl-D-amino-acid deacylase
MHPTDLDNKTSFRDGPPRVLLRPGLAADITIFNPETVLDQSTYTEPFHYNIGIEYVIVNGTVVLEHEKHTGARPGKVLRHQ